MAAGLLLGWGPVAAVVLGGVTYVTSSGITAKVIGDLDWIGHRETPVAVIAWATVWIDNHLTADPLDIIGVLVAGVALAVGTLLPGPRTTRSSGGNEDRA